MRTGTSGGTPCRKRGETAESAHFLDHFRVDITVWKTLWKMCKTLKCERFVKVTASLWENLRNNLFRKNGRRAAENREAAGLSPDT